MNTGWAVPLALCAATAVLLGCGPDPEHALQSAQVALEAGDDGASQAAFRRALDRHPEDAELLVFAARFYLREESPDHYKPRLSLHYAHRACEAAPGRADAAAAEIEALVAMGQIEDARQRWATASEQHPDDPALALLGELF